MCRLVHGFLCTEFGRVRLCSIRAASACYLKHQMSEMASVLNAARAGWFQRTQTGFGWYWGLYFTSSFSGVFCKPSLFLASRGKKKKKHIILQ